MIRFLGFVLGAMATIGAVMMVTGLPEIVSPTPVASHIESPAPIKPESTVADSTEVEAVADPVTPPQQVAHPGLATARSDPSPGPEESIETGPAETFADTLPGAVPPRADTDATAAGPHWHTFWNPFRSEIAANGFAARLQTVTGIDYRVVKLEPGSYQVAFAYGDDTERRSKISQIEAATGLRLPEDLP